jgi:UDP:flavonoid glycosyltransferase YjiC (YdhE family)
VSEGEGGGLRVLVSAGFGEGHAYPALALSRELSRRGHRVMVELSERWRETVTQLGMELTPAVDYIAFPGVAPPDPSWPTVLDAVADARRAIEEFGADVVVSDLVAPASGLAAETAGIPAASLVPLVYPIQGPGAPPFELGLLPARSRLGAHAWQVAERATRPLRAKSRWLAEVPGLLAETRSRLGLPPLDRARQRITTYGALSDGLVMVATFPQLEYPRRWPAHVHVTGPMPFELPAPEIELPEGDDPLIVVAASTVHSGRALIRAALAGLEREPVRVVATLNRRGETWEEPVPANATVVDWASYTQVMSAAAVVISSGGHGTLARALSLGVPALVCPAGAETAENGARVSWSGAGLMLPRRLLGPRAVRFTVRRLLRDRRFRERAADFARWAREHDGARRGAELVESYVAGAGSARSEPR